MADVKLFRPQRLTDNPDGGGLATATEIVDGEINNLFDDISRIDRVNGELSLRKTFVMAATPDTALYSDVHVIVQAPPLDPRVEGVIFRTKDWDDVRADAQSAVERYLDESVITRMIPYDRQLAGQRTVLVYQRPELSLPEIGEVYALKNEAAATVEFVRVQDIDHQVETFTDINGDYKARVITLTISQPLSVEFSGSQPNRYFTADINKSVLRKTVASDAARYKGVVRLAQDANVGDLTIKVASVFVQLVPAATSEVAVTDAAPEGSTMAVASGTVNITTAPMSMDSAPTQIAFAASAQPGIVVQTSPGARWEEQADGSFAMVDGSELGLITIGPGRMSVQLSGFNTGTRAISATYKPAAQVAKAGRSLQIPVEIANRGYVYAPVLRPLPQPSTTTVSFRALGRWYTLQDAGAGELIGEPGTGSGLVNFATGSAPTSLGALPDIGSAVIYNFGTATEYEVRTGDIDIKVPAVDIQLAAGNCEPGTFSVEWLAGVATKTANDDGQGNITGDATGRVVYATGQVRLHPAVLPNSNTVFTVDYEAGTTLQEVFTPTATGGSVVITASGAPMQAGSILISTVGFQQDRLGNIYQAATQIVDDGAGGLRYLDGGTVTGGLVAYSTGQITLPTTLVLSQAKLERASYGGGLPSREASLSTGMYIAKGVLARWPSATKQFEGPAGFINGTAVNLSYRLAGLPATITDEEHEAGPLLLDLTPKVSNSIVPGGVLFDLGGRQYYERAGTLYYGHDPRTGAGTAAGSIDYVGGTALISSYAGGVAPGFSIKSLLTEVAPLPLSVVNGRTPGSPLRPGTFYLQANRYSDGELISGTADNNGNIDTTDMHGWVDVVNGVFQVAFGRYVLDSTLTSDDKAEDWYDAAFVDEDGYIWRPEEAIPGTVRFNCVVQASLPQDPEIIKVNPVRLPMDGRVQAIRAGDTLVIHDSQPYTMPDNLIASQEVTLPRTQLASVALYDQVGLGVPTSLYTVDIELGVVAMADPLDLSAYAEPLVAIHTIEDMALGLDAQITGEVALGQPLTHGYTAANSLCSSALILGDAQARYGSLFAQATWTNVWDDSIIGDPPVSGALYNDALFPIAVQNDNAITQRWRLAFTSSTNFNIVGETLGVIGTGTTSTDVEPLNPATGEPYFSMPAAGFGGGWATGNNIRLNTFGAGGPIWVARTVRSGPATEQDDRLRLQARWDKD